MNWPRNEESLEERRQHWRDRYGKSDEAAGICTTEEFTPFRQIDDVFTRAFWDESVRSRDSDAFFASYREGFSERRGDGFGRKDFALRNASWLISDLITDRHSDLGRREGFQAAISDDTPVMSERIAVDDPAAQATEIKLVARFFGASLCGITDYDERWTYESRVDVRDFSEAPAEVPEGIESVIVLGHEMDETLVRTYPSALGGAATGREYSHEAATVMQVAAYIRALGYLAVASMNDTALVIPYALKAGLGEYARNQLVIAPKTGPRLRFSKIFTNLPLAHDKPRKYGVAEFCSVCTRCADACPVKALPYGPPTTDQPNRSAIVGVVKWTSDAEKCFGYWATLKSDCAICMRVCPFNRDFRRWWNRLWLKLALSPLRRIALWIDDRSGRAQRVRPREWWSRGT